MDKAGISLTRRKVDTSSEKNITIGCIVSKQFIEHLTPLYNHHYIQNDFARRIIGWCLRHHKNYGEPPLENIQSIYEMEKERLKEEESEIIASFLVKLSDQYVGEDQGFNLNFNVDNMVRYFKLRELELRVAGIQSLLEDGKVEDAEEAITGYRKIAKATSKWFNPFDHSIIVETFNEQANTLFQLPGELGRLIGPFEREWLISVMGPWKRGKTWWLQELAINAINSRLPTAFISLEMKRTTQARRIYQSITGAGSEDNRSSLFRYPCFDCYHNQTNECTKPERTNNIRLRDDNNDKPQYNPNCPYTPCTYCKDNGLTDDYQAETWWEQIERPFFTQSHTVRELKRFGNMFGDNNLRVICYPKFSANISDIQRDLDHLYYFENFAPSVIIIDYLGILKPEDSRIIGIERIDETWKTAARLAGERKALVATGSQGTRGSQYKPSVDQNDLAQWIGQLAHIDLMFGLHQTAVEKREGVMRVNLMIHRHKEFDEDYKAIVLQNLGLGQVDLDSHIVFDPRSPQDDNGN